MSAAPTTRKDNLIMLAKCASLPILSSLSPQFNMHRETLPTLPSTKGLTRITQGILISLRLANCHALWAPLSGTIERMTIIDLRILVCGANNALDDRKKYWSTRISMTRIPCQDIPGAAKLRCRWVILCHSIQLTVESCKRKLKTQLLASELVPTAALLTLEQFGWMNPNSTQEVRTASL